MALWLYDFVGQGAVPGRREAVTALAICRALKYFDFGLELAIWFRDKGVLDPDIVADLERPEAWTS